MIMEVDVQFQERCSRSLSGSGRSAVEIARYLSALELLAPYRRFLRGRVLDFGASYGLSMLALTALGVEEVWGVEPCPDRVRAGHDLLTGLGMVGTRLQHVPDTLAIPWPDEAFDSILALAVFEHIPQPRHGYFGELWRLLKPGGHLLIAETPNPYFPIDMHTTGLPFVPWLPSRVAHAVGQRWGRNPTWYNTPEKWRASGWRGMGFYELAGAIPGDFEVIHQNTRLRHAVLKQLGLFPGLVDPYPFYVLRKRS
ncbi:MAG: class I SAM-dependent methyltransferase [Gemmatimonadales bacterium]|nr:MAG: class I SAM-dependent methyltransferase [Gemmatimonadales bacterium]